MKPIIFFDGGCPLCKREIAHYQRIDKRKAIQWIDISQPSAELDDYGISQRDAMEKIHGVNAQGQTLVGANTFVMMWQQLPYYRHLGNAIHYTGLTSPLNKIYDRFARWRFKRRCKDGCSL